MSICNRLSFSSGLLNNFSLFPPYYTHYNLVSLASFYFLKYSPFIITRVELLHMCTHSLGCSSSSSSYTPLSAKLALSTFNLNISFQNLSKSSRQVHLFVLFICLLSSSRYAICLFNNTVLVGNCMCIGLFASSVLIFSLDYKLHQDPVVSALLIALYQGMILFLPIIVPSPLVPPLM